VPSSRWVRFPQSHRDAFAGYSIVKEPRADHRRAMSSYPYGAVARLREYSRNLPRWRLKNDEYFSEEFAQIVAHWRNRLSKFGGASRSFQFTRSFDPLQGLARSGWQY